MSKHTPGPWRWYDDTDAAGKNNRHEIQATGKTICHIYTSVPHEDSANARLIAAAPDLLEALKRIMAGFDDGVWVRSIKEEGDAGWAMRLLPHVQALGAAMTAIKKAEGE